MEKFYCREEELQKLNTRYEDGNFECVVIYGRRIVEWIVTGGAFFAHCNAFLYVKHQCVHHISRSG